MSKKTSVNPVGSFSISGGPSANYANGNTTFRLNKAQQDAYDFAQNSFAENLPGINVFSPETQSGINKQVQAYQNNALETLNEVYEPLLRQTMNDSARRFGNLDNSVYLQNLGAVENKRAKAASSLAQDVASKRNELVSDELQNRYNYLNFLNNYQNQLFNNALQATNSANNAANMQAKYSASSGNNDLMKLLTTAAALTGKFI